jgi:hypothetical protein
MNKVLSALLIFLSGSSHLLFASSVVFASSLNGYPCIKNICVGDDIKNISGVNWIPATKLIKKPKPLQAIGNAASIKAFAPYWNSGQLDTKSIQLLSGIEGFCEAKYLNSFEASYLNEENKLVIVNFGILISDNGKSQKFIVKQIQRVLYVGQVTQSQIEEVKIQNRQKYPLFTKANPMMPSANIFTAGKALYLDLSLPGMGPKSVGYPETDAMLNFPGCVEKPNIKL